MTYFMMLSRCINFYLSLMLCTMVFVIRQGRRRLFPLRLLLVFGGGVLLMNHLHYLFLMDYRSMSSFGNAVIYISALFYTWSGFVFCFDITWSEACFCIVAGYSGQFIQSILSEILVRYYGLSSTQGTLVKLLMIVVIVALLYAWIGKKLKRGQNFNVAQWHLMVLLICVILVEIVICYRMRMQWIYALDKGHMLCDGILLAMCSAIVLAAQFALLDQQDLTHELEILRQMWRKDREQYRISSETIDLINRKCHDMRFQIRSIGRNANVVPNAIRDMEKAINIYDSLYQTGCRALDIILTEKSLQCQTNQIVLTCIAAGVSALNAISDVDIYSLFGNLLENAIKAVSELEVEYRAVDLTIREHGEFLSIQVSNSFMGSVEMREGLPVTTSADPANHGFGVKSIAAIVQKYDGTVSFDVDGNVFSVSILFTKHALETMSEQESWRHP